MADMVWFSPSTLNSDKNYNMNGVLIKEYLLANHNANNVPLPTKRTHNFKGVVIHNTNLAKSEDDGRQYTAATLNGNVASRTHYYITYLGAWKNLNDEDMNWTCGDTTKGDGNNGCISLEIIMGSRQGVNDLKARDNGAKIAAYILFKNNMTVNDMYTHNYFLNIRNGVKGDYNKLCTTATPTRNCPYYIVWDWEGFRKQVDNYIKILGGKSVYGQEKVIENAKSKYPKIVYIATSSAAMRDGMSKNSKIFGRVTKGKYYPAEKIDKTWIRHPDTGYYSMLKDGPSLFTEIGEYKIGTTKNKLNVRNGPSTKSNKVVVLEAGTQVVVLNEGAIRNDGYTWNRVVINGNIAYLAGEYLKYD